MKNGFSKYTLKVLWSHSLAMSFTCRIKIILKLFSFKKYWAFWLGVLGRIFVCLFLLLFKIWFGVVFYFLNYFLLQPISTLLPPFAVSAPNAASCPELNKAAPVFVQEAGFQNLHPAPLTVLSAGTSNAEQVVWRIVLQASTASAAPSAHSLSPQDLIRIKT